MFDVNGRIMSAQLIESAIHTARYGGLSHLGGMSLLKKLEAAQKIATTLNQLPRGG